MKRKAMKKATSKQRLTPKQRAELKALTGRPRTDLIPEIRDFAGFKRGLFYRPIKQQLTLRIDADIIAWFKKNARGQGYQTSINRALREYVVGRT
jgi:uncharacterized protein (DUF4415 family)